MGGIKRSSYSGICDDILLDLLDYFLCLFRSFFVDLLLECSLCLGGISLDNFLPGLDGSLGFICLDLTFCGFTDRLCFCEFICHPGLGDLLLGLFHLLSSEFCSIWGFQKVLCGDLSEVLPGLFFCCHLRERLCAAFGKAFTDCTISTEI